jgi:hypothetical protein
MSVLANRKQPVKPRRKPADGLAALVKVGRL